MSETERRYYHMQIAGCERDLPLCPISDTTEIAGFVMLGDVEITEHTAAELLEKWPGARCDHHGRNQRHPSCL